MKKIKEQNNEIRHESGEILNNFYNHLMWVNSRIRTIHGVTVLRKMKSAAMLMISSLNGFIPKSNKVLFYNDVVRDNNKYVMEYLAENSKVDIVCYSEERINQLDQKNNVKYFSSLPFLFYQFLTSRVVVTSFDHRYMIKPAKGQRVIQLWHGYALKNIGHDDQNPLRARRGYYYTDILCYSDYWKESLVRAFGCDETQLRIWDNPRNDLLYIPTPKTQVVSFLNIEYTKFILWMPTYRKSARMHGSEDSNKDIPIINPDNCGFLNEKLKKAGNILVIKPHPLQNRLNEVVDGLSNIFLIYNEDLKKEKIELYQFLAAADALLTDYSSVYFDYLKLNRPVGFAIDDYDEYEGKRGFAFKDPIGLMPGPIIENAVQLSEFLENPYRKDEQYKEKRTCVRKTISQWDDDNNCKRVTDYIVSLLE